MKKIFVLFVLTFVMIFGSTCFAVSLHDYPNVAVLPYANKAAVSSELTLNDASMVSEFVIEQLLDANLFNIIEREEIEAVVKEHQLNMTGLVDNASAVQLGKLAGAQFLIKGSVTGLSTKSSGVGVSIPQAGADFNKNTVVANITLRFIEVETGRIVLAASGTGESARTKTEFELKKMSKEEYETTLENEDGSIETVTDTGETKTNSYKVTIGGENFSQVQVRNALYKAVYDVVYNKNFGVIAKMNGKNKLRKV